MKVLELFAGSRSISNVAESLGHTTFATDIEPFQRIDYVCDILMFDPNAVPFQPDMIWASPPCTGFSVAALGRNWDKVNGRFLPKSDSARLGMQILQETILLIEYFQPAVWYIENPRGVMRKMDILQRYPRHTVTYCQYGDTRMKPTDIWTNNATWQPRPHCKNGDPCHEAAPRGSRTGTQALKGNYERSKIPPELCTEIIKATEHELHQGRTTGNRRTD